MSTRFLRSLSRRAAPAAAVTSRVSGRGGRLLHTYLVSYITYRLLILVQVSAKPMQAKCTKCHPSYRGSEDGTNGLSISVYAQSINFLTLVKTTLVKSLVEGQQCREHTQS